MLLAVNSKFAEKKNLVVTEGSAINCRDDGKRKEEHGFLITYFTPI